MTWVALPQGQTIAIKKGSTYAAVVSTSHSEADIRSFAVKHGLQVYYYASGQGQVTIAGTAVADGSIPWGVPGILSWIDDSHAVSAWVDSSGGAPTPPGGEMPVPMTPVYVVGGLVVATGVGWWLWHRRR